MSYGGESFGVRPFFIVAPIVLGDCLLSSVDVRGHLGEKSVADNIYMSEASHCVVSLSKTHLSLFKYWFNPGRPVPIYLKNC